MVFFATLLLLDRSITRLSLEVLFFTNLLVLCIVHGAIALAAIVTVRDFSDLRVFIVILMCSSFDILFALFVTPNQFVFFGCHSGWLQFYQPAGSSWFVSVLTSDHLVVTLYDVSDFELFGFVVLEDELHSSFRSVDFNASISTFLLLNLKVLRSDRLNILVLDGVSQCLELLWWTPIVFKHDEKCLRSSEWPLALASVAIPCPVAVEATDAPCSLFLRKQAVIYLLH